MQGVVFEGEGGNSGRLQELVMWFSLATRCADIDVMIDDIDCIDV